MDNIGYYVRRVRNRVEYIRADYTQKYYSTSKNPRVVQTRLSHLTSLRTCQDKYDILPGEFLAVDPQQREMNRNSREARVVESAPLPFLKVVQSAPMAAESAPLTIGCKCECHTAETKFTPIFTPIFTAKRKWFRSSKHKASEIKLDSSSIEINSALIPQDTEDLIKFHNQNQENNKNSIPEISWIKTQNKTQNKAHNHSHNLSKDSPYRRLLRQYSFAEGTRLSSAESNQVWRSVLNDVSLSAARISTGALPTSKLDLAPVSADFTREDWYDVISYYAHSE